LPRLAACCGRLGGLDLTCAACSGVFLPRSMQREHTPLLGRPPCRPRPQAFA
jgi:hypothetical protein